MTKQQFYPNLAYARMLMRKVARNDPAWQNPSSFAQLLADSILTITITRFAEEAWRTDALHASMPHPKSLPIIYPPWANGTQDEALTILAQKTLLEARAFVEELTSIPDIT